MLHEAACECICSAFRLVGQRRLFVGIFRQRLMSGGCRCRICVRAVPPGGLPAAFLMETSGVFLPPQGLRERGPGGRRGCAAAVCGRGPGDAAGAELRQEYGPVRRARGRPHGRHKVCGCHQARGEPAQAGQAAVNTLPVLAALSEVVPTREHLLPHHKPLGLPCLQDAGRCQAHQALAL